MLPHVSIDIIHAEILPRLPRKSLMRFKTVCKSFNAIISSPEFTRLRLQHPLSNESRLLVTNGTKRTVDIYDLDSSSCVVPYATFRWYSFITTVVGSCNGLLLIRLHRNIQRVLPLILLNPTTQSYIEFRSTDVNGVDGHVGFGFDEHSDDYKIVLVSGTSERYIEGDRVTRVYSINSKSWKVVDRTGTSDYIEKPFASSYNGVLVNNHLLHWIIVKRSADEERTLRRAHNDEGKLRKIGCFDVISETWVEDLLFPDYYYDPKRKGKFLDFGVLDGCLYSSFVDPKKSFEVWVMKEYGVHDSWTKLLSIEIREGIPIATPFTDSMITYDEWGYGIGSMTRIPGGFIPIACRGQGGESEVLLMERYESNTLFWYNWKKNKTTGDKFPNAYGHLPYFVEETLVQLPDAQPFGDLYCD